MKKVIKQLVASIGVGLLVAFPVAASAATFLSQNQVDLNQASTSDVYAVGDMVSIRGDVQGDVFAAGSTVETTRQISGDVIVAGQTVMIRGSVGDDVMAAGNSVIIEADQAQDVFAAGNSIVIGENTRVSGDAYLAGNTVFIQGDIAGTVRVGAASVRLGSTAEIRGDLITYGDAEPRIIRDEGAVIRGEQRHIKAPLPERKDAAKVIGGLKLGDWLLKIVTWTILSWLLILAARGVAMKVVQTFRARPAVSAGIGALWIIAFIPAAILLMITVIGIPAAFLLGLLTMGLMILASGYANIVVGSYLAKYIFRSRTEGMLSWQEAFIGAAVLASIRIVPVVGGLVTTIITVMALGSLLIASGRIIRQQDAN